MDDFGYERERRHQARLERLGTDDGCMLCDEDFSQIIEQHHPGGRKYTGTEVPICRNHHGKAEALRLAHPREGDGPATELECNGRELLGLVDLLSLVAHVPAELVTLIRRIGLRLISGELPNQGAPK